MDRRKTPQIVYLDTHIVMWLHDGLLEKLSPKARETIEQGRIMASLLVELELQYLKEIGRIRPKPSQIMAALAKDIGLETGKTPLEEIVKCACKLEWTRDPFDRLIVGEAVAASALLITRDQNILRNFDGAVW